MTARLASWIPLIALTASAALAPQGARGNDLNAMIKQFCLAAVKTELAQAGKTAPSGMPDFSCDCVVDKMASGVDLDDAKTICRRLTASRYGL